MANPFLFMEEEVNAAPTNDAFANPFLVEDDDDDGADFPSENPFSASNPFAFNDTEHDASANDANFFMADDDDEEVEEHNNNQQQQQQHADPTMSFFDTTINEHDDINYHINEAEHTNFSEAELKSVPPQRPAQTTQQMINTLTHHLDQTSTSLLEKLPVTRSPSPVSMRDLHSPSPTPDVGDLLDVSDAFAAATEKEQQQQQAIVNNNNHEEHKPNRPPPPRPVPPRPTPPTTVSTPIQPIDTATVTQSNQQQQHHQHEDDLFDLFGTGQQKKPPPKPPAPKTKEDILSLYTPPTQAVSEVQKPDLLSDEIVFTETKVEEQPKPATPPQPTKVAVVQPYVDQTEVPTIPQAIVEPIMQQQQQPIENHLNNNRAIPMITEDMVEDRPQSDFMDEPEEEQVIQPKSEISSDHSPTESGIISSGGIPASNSGSIINMQMQEEPVAVVQEEANPFADKTPTPQNEQLKFLTERPVDYQHQRPTTPDPIVSQPELAPIFNVGQPTPVVQNVKPAKPPPPARISSVLTTVQQPQVVQQPVVTQTNPIIPEVKQLDDFDDFSAKFESTGAQKVTGNAFLDSLGPTASATSGDAWGDSSSDAFGASSTTNDGFGGDDGFDNWDVPAAPESTPYAKRRMSNDSNEGDSFNVSIKPKVDFDYGIAPALAPPQQKSPYSGSAYSEGEFKVASLMSFLFFNSI